MIPSRELVPCLYPGCRFAQHSDPASLWKPGYCCNKCAGKHAGEEWAEGGCKHYSHCEGVLHTPDWLLDDPQRPAGGGGGRVRGKKKNPPRRATP